MADQKPVDSAQIVLDQKRGGAPGGGGGRCSGGASMGGLVFKIVAVLFVVGNVTALYVLHFVNRPSPTTRFSFANFEAASGTSAKVGDVVSLSTDSKLRNGAGTTAYLNRATLSTSDVSYYEYINVAPLGTSKSNYATNLMSYRRVPKSGSAASVLTTFTVDPATKAVSISDAYDATKNVVDKAAIRGIATLSDTAAMVLTVDDSGWPYTTSVTPATISSTGGATLASANSKQIASGSATNFLARLNGNSAIVAYYDEWNNATDYFQHVRVATIGSDGAVTLSAAKPFGPANNAVTKVSTTFGKPVAISASQGVFAVPYYTSDESGLCLTMATYASATVGTFTTGVCNTKFRPAYYPEGVMLSDSIMLLAFHDSANNNALTLVTAQVTATTAFFRSSFVFAEVGGDFDYGHQYGFSPDVSVALLAGNRVAVSFLNPSMNGRQSVKVVKYSLESLSFKDVTPVLPLAAASFTININGGALKKAVTQSVLSVGSDSVVAMYMGVRGATPHQHVAVVEAFGSAVGVLRDLDGKTKASVAISGKATDVKTKGNGKLVEGQFYYATTSGCVATPVAGTSAGADVFTASEDANMLVTADSKIGLATDDDELFVSTAL